jgi:hypothetical protein
VIQGGGGPGFATEALEGLGIARQVIRQKLERHGTAELEVLGFVDDAHAAAAELRQDAVTGDGLSSEAGSGALVRHVATPYDSQRVFGRRS